MTKAVPIICFVHLQLQSLNVFSWHAAILYATRYYCMKPYKMKVPNCALFAIMYNVC